MMADHIPDDVDVKKPLPNEMQERFCQERSVGYSNGNAYLRAVVVEKGEKNKISKDVARTLGWRLFQKVYVRARVDYLKKERLKRFNDLEKSIEQEYRKAISDKTYSSADHLTALRDASKFIGKDAQTINQNVTGSINVKVSYL